MENDDKESKKVELKKNIGYFSGIAINVGTIIGAGIFVSPNSVINYCGSVGLSLICWAIGGVLSWLGALCYAELGTTYPVSGGDYAYLNLLFGELPAFMYMWTSFLILSTTGKATSALTFATYILDTIFPNEKHPYFCDKLIAITLIWLIIFFNAYKLKIVHFLIKIMTFAKVLALLSIIGVGIYYISHGIILSLSSLVYHHFCLCDFDLGSFINFIPENAFKYSTRSPKNITLAIFAALYSFSGWNSLNFMIEEVKNPQRKFPIIIGGSLAIVTTIYILVNISYFSVLSAEESLNSEAVALTFAEKTLGNAYVLTMMSFILFSIFGSLNGSMMSTSRIFYASSRNGHLPALLCMINIKYNTPMMSLLFIEIITTIYILTNDIGSLLVYYTFSEAVFAFLTILGLAISRMKKKDVERPFKINKLTIIVYLVLSLCLIVTPLISNATNCLISIGIILSSLPFYYIFIHKKFESKALHKIIGSITTTFQKVFYVTVPDNSIAKDK